MKLPAAPPSSAKGTSSSKGLATYPHAISALDPTSQMPIATMFAPSMASIFPRFAYYDINALIWLFGYRYRRTIKTPPHEYARVNWQGMSIGSYYAAVRRALVVAVVLRAVAAVGGLSWLFVTLKRRIQEKRSLRATLGF